MIPQHSHEPQAIDNSFELLVSFVQTSITDDYGDDFTAEEVEEELFDVTVEFVIITTEAVIEARAGLVEGEPQVIAVYDDLGAPQLFLLKEIPAGSKKG